jgi:hypothetical protein
MVGQHWERDDRFAYEDRCYHQEAEKDECRECIDPGHVGCIRSARCGGLAAIPSRRFGATRRRAHGETGAEENGEHGCAGASFSAGTPALR